MTPEESRVPEVAASADAATTSGDGAFPVVGIGASAGGLEAVGQLLAHVPEDTGMAFVLVQHLDPNHESRLVELLGKSSRLPVVEATDGMVLEPDRVHVIPPNASLTVAEGVLRIEPRGQSR